MKNFVTVRDVVERMEKAGDGRRPSTLRVFVIRAIHNRSLPGAEKVGPATGMWLIPAESANNWLGSSRPEQEQGRVAYPNRQPEDYRAQG